MRCHAVVIKARSKEPPASAATLEGFQLLKIDIYFNSIIKHEKHCERSTTSNFSMQKSPRAPPYVVRFICACASPAIKQIWHYHTREWLMVIMSLGTKAQHSSVSVSGMAENLCSLLQNYITKHTSATRMCQIKLYPRQEQAHLTATCF